MESTLFAGVATTPVSFQCEAESACMVVLTAQPLDEATSTSRGQISP